MYRVITRYLDGVCHQVVEHGPWLASRSSAERWAKIFRMAGYDSEVEVQSGLVHRDHGHQAPKKEPAEAA